VEPSEVFIYDLVASCPERPENSENHDITEAKDFDEDASQFVTCTIDSAKARVICGNPSTRPGGKEDANFPNQDEKIGVNLQNSPSDTFRNYSSAGFAVLPIFRGLHPSPLLEITNKNLQNYHTMQGHQIIRAGRIHTSPPLRMTDKHSHNHQTKHMVSHGSEAMVIAWE